jgi:hypothetical protein
MTDFGDRLRAVLRKINTEWVLWLSEKPSTTRSVRKQGSLGRESVV